MLCLVPGPAAARVVTGGRTMPGQDLVSCEASLVVPDFTGWHERNDVLLLTLGTRDVKAIGSRMGTVQAPLCQVPNSVSQTRVLCCLAARDDRRDESQSLGSSL